MEAGFVKKLKWRIEAGAHSCVSAVFRQLPAETVFALGEFLGRVIWPFLGARRKTIERNLRIAGVVGAEESERAARKSFIHTVANLMCSNVSANMRGEDIGEVLEVENPELLAEAVAGSEKDSIDPIPHDKCKLAVEFLGDSISIMLIGSQQDFRVGTSTKTPAQ
jgi:lauroyl/myristoyl acyltransferase